jgi:hypothetical protein
MSMTKVLLEMLFLMKMWNVNKVVHAIAIDLLSDKEDSKKDQMSSKR